MTRKGITIIESLAACFLVSMATMFALQFFQAAEVQRRSVNQRLTAEAIAANVTDRLSSLGWDDLPLGKFDTRKNLDGGKKIATAIESSESGKMLAEGGVVVDVTATAGPPEGKRISVRVEWQPGLGPSKNEVHLVAWKYRGT
jgi:hypothetical protein